MSASQNDVRLTVNGEVFEGPIEARMLLSDFLRDELELTGTHVGCEHGVCGACTVKVNGEAVRSCLMFAAQLDGAVIATIEGLAAPGHMHPLQDAFHRNSALQCGFCTAGMIIAAEDFLKANPDPTELEVREAMSGNICRCTGYHPIVKAILEAAPKLAAGAKNPEAKD